jgi:hypothetical protein
MSSSGSSKDADVVNMVNMVVEDAVVVAVAVDALDAAVVRTKVETTTITIWKKRNRK